MLTDRLRQAFRYFVLPHRFVKLDDNLASDLARLADEEERALDDLGCEMLTFALQHRQAAVENLGQWKTLTPREQQVTALTCLGYTNRQTAYRLSITPSTVRTHLKNAKRKFGLRTNLELRNALADWNFQAWDR
jgi:DNA-binding CsgD family transcriptional regulator